MSDDDAYVDASLQASGSSQQNDQEESSQADETGNDTEEETATDEVVAGPSQLNASAPVGPSMGTRAKTSAHTAFVALTTFSGREAAARKRGEAAVKLNQIQELLDTARDVVEAVTDGNARTDLSEEEVQHDVNEMEHLRQELSEFDVSALGVTWRSRITQEIAQKEAALMTASAMLAKRAPQASTAPAARTAGTSTPAPTRGGKTGSGGNPAAGERTRGRPSRSQKGGKRRRAASAGPGGDEATRPGVAQPARAASAQPVGGSAATSRRLIPPASAQARLMTMAYGAEEAVPASAPTHPAPAATGGDTRPPVAPPPSALPPAQFVSNNLPVCFPYPPPPLPPSATTSAARGAGWAPAAPLTTSAGPNLAAPSWQAQPTRPYAPNTCNLGNEYYLSFPYPWNSLPEQGEVSVSHVLKVGSQALPKFSGDRRSYITWRGSFLPGVHLKPIDVSYKILLLRGCMIPANARMKEFIDSIVASPEGYRQAVVTLEERYGGAAALLMTRQEALMELPEVKEGDFRLLETLHCRLGTFLLEWEGITGAPLNERESLAYYLSLMAKVEHSYSRKYLEWLENKGKTENLRSFYEWLGGELQRHRRVEVYALQRGRPPTRGVGDPVRPSRPTPPASALDRNFPRQRGFLAAWEEGQEGAEEPPPEEEESTVYTAQPQVQETSVPRRPPCTLCQGDHGLGRCEQFKALTPAARKELLVKEGRCFLCFQKGHSVARCHFNFKCVKCGRKHHTLLHGADANAGTAFFTMEEEEDDVEGATASLEYGMLTRKRDESPPTAQTLNVSLRTVPVLLVNPFNGESVHTNAMLDDGCTGSAILDEALAKRLQLKGQVRWTSTEGVGGHVTRYQTVFTCIRVLNINTRTGVTIPAQVMKRPAGTYMPVNWAEQKQHFPHLLPLPLPAPVADVGIGIMLGNQNPTLMASREEVVGGEGDPVARRTLLGWTVVGPSLPGQEAKATQAKLACLRRTLPRGDTVPPPLPEGQLIEWNAEAERCLLSTAEPTDRQLVKLLQRMLAVEDPGEATLLSPREEYIVKQARDTLVRRQGGQYQVGCTWAPGTGRPPLAQKQAEDRLRSLERGKHFRNKEIQKAYHRVIQEWEAAGYVQQVPLQSEHVKHLLPHFPILKESETTPVRPVMDCSTELNKYLLSGPNLLNNVPEVLLRFRSGLYSFSGDVKQMFLKIFLSPQDRPYHCFLWRTETDGPIVVYQFQVHVFGNAGSPFLAVFVVREHARRYEAQFPKATETLLHSTLIDDVLDSADTATEAREVLLAIRTILSEAGMQLTKSHSNSGEVLSVLKPDEVAAGMLDVSAACHKEPSLARLKALGIRYDPREDTFRFSLKIDGLPSVWTKRWMLKIFPRLFDPLGLVLPFAMVARMLFSLIASKEHSWDTPLSEEHCKTWKKWLAQLPALEQFSLPRCVKTQLPTRAELHIFSDASSNAYAAAAYLKCTYATGTPSTRLVCARAHVVPSGRLSVPRLELLAADLAVKVREQVLRTLKVNVAQIYHWTDSTTVLCWLHNEKNRLQLFVFNKVKKIQAGSNLAEWGWVPTDANPADIPSRGCTAEHLCHSHMWRAGPDFLSDPAKWPVPPVLLTTPAVLAEMRQEERLLLTLHHSTVREVLDWTRIGSWTKGIRMVQRILRWRDRVRVKLQLPPLGDSYARAECSLLKQAQLMFTPPSQQLATRHWAKMGFTRLLPFQDAGGLWRGEGRLRSHHNLPLDLREPLLLPRGHRAAELIVRHLHERVLHHAGGVNHVLARFQARFWLPKARAFVYALLTQCVDCRRRKARPSRPPEGQLPQFRLPPLEQGAQPIAFAVTAVDCAGPFRVKRGRAYETHYLLLITCCQIRAVRLEVLSDLTVDAFMMALTRASARGVLPHTILSDNGGNFEGANRLLRALWKALPQAELESRRPDIKWRFNPPYASHYGGVFERLIRAAKEALYHVLPSQLTLSLEELLTAFAIVEGILNTRPLAYTSTDGKDYTPITPNHFLHGAASEPLLRLDSSSTLAKRWSNLQEMTRVFLRRFHQEVRPHLQLTHTKRGGGRDLKKGDIVVFLLPSGSKMWPLARVSAVFPGPDGRVRTVELLLPQTLGHGKNYQRGVDKTFRRDVGEVALLLPAEAAQPRDSL